MRRFLWIPLAWLLITLSLAGPQLAIAYAGSKIVGGVVGAVLLGLLGLVLVRFAKARHSALVGLAIVTGIVGLTASIGTTHFQLGIGLSRGAVQDGVPLAEVLARGKEGTWVRITDARVRSEDTHTLQFVRGARNGPQTHESVSVAPVSLASEVSNESWSMRTKLVGTRSLWACSESAGAPRQWDTERQAVRGRLARMADNVRESLNHELEPTRRIAPGAGAIPAAPGARLSASGGAEALSASDDAWCVHLDPSLDANGAKASALSIAFALLLVLPLFCLGVLAVALSRSTNAPLTPRA